MEPLEDEGYASVGSRLFNTLRDVTTERRTEENLRETERRLSDMLGNVQMLSVMVDREARISYCNDYLLRLTGYGREEVIGRDWFERFIREPSVPKANFAALLANQPEAVHRESEILTRSGERRLIRWNNSVLRSAAGDVIGTASIGEDGGCRDRGAIAPAPFAEVRRNARILIRQTRADRHLRNKIPGPSVSQSGTGEDESW
jgi:PAS domain S-box-containing protein